VEGALIPYVLRFLIGGFFVATFSLLGEVFKPKSFAGLFSAAPSIALATLALTAFQRGKATAAIEARSMVLGAIAFLFYARWVLHELTGHAGRPRNVAIAALPAWLIVAALGWTTLWLGTR
jgi:Protein of unknown function (DUF3147)